MTEERYDRYDDDVPTCPYCGHRHEESDVWDFRNDIECHNCDRMFEAWPTAWSSRKVE